jgi:hypothetical protein
MAGRREFLQAGIAASLLPRAVAGGNLAASERTDRAAFYKGNFRRTIPSQCGVWRRVESARRGEEPAGGDRRIADGPQDTRPAGRRSRECIGLPKKMIEEAKW